jgi:hypothetical protein
MSLEDLSAIGSFVSGVAIATTLIFLLIQTRPAYHHAKALMQQGRTARTVELMMRISDPRRSSIIVRADSGDLTLTSSEVYSYLRLCSSFFWNFEDSYLQFRAGTLDKVGWRSDLAALRQFATSPANRAAWSLVRDYSGGPYQALMDGLMREIKGAPPADLAQIWRTRMSQELADARLASGASPQTTAAAS